jgi:hypothetical protein
MMRELIERLEEGVGKMPSKVRASVAAIKSIPGVRRVSVTDMDLNWTGMKSKRTGQTLDKVRFTMDIDLPKRAGERWVHDKIFEKIAPKGGALENVKLRGDIEVNPVTFTGMFFTESERA